ncbi:MAG TPA: FAD-binding oxidoreductase [Acetobacteraceae bacterium]|jgi:glycine/D-amino acid oxidase-like deaminating enzyme|nr:FAD-binding oxidoreductase [Acetobacteraceae bacterium]
MSPPVEAVQSDPDVPDRADVVIIGGGIIGTSTALFLAEKGHSVVLCEKGRIAGEQSSRNWGWCRTMGRDAREIPLAIESLRLWRGMNACTGRETGYRQAGVVYLCENEKEVAAQETWLREAQQYQVDAHLLRGEAIDALVPGASSMFVAAMHTPTDGRAEPSHAAPAIAEAARAAGATILTDCAVRGIETQAGRVCGVVTEKGRIRCDAVVLAGGAWSRLFCGNAGIELPQLRVLASVFRTAPLSGAPEVAVGGSVFAFRKRLDGGYTIARRNANVADITPDSFRLLLQYWPTLKQNYGEIRLHFGRRFFEELRIPRRWSLDKATPFEAVRVWDPAPRQATLKEAREVLSRRFPVFARMQVAESWGGMIDVTPDAVPVIGEVPSLPGFFLATGFSGHGFGIGPGAGRLAADLVAGDPPIVDPVPFRFGRFSERRS